MEAGVRWIKDLQFEAFPSLREGILDAPEEKGGSRLGVEPMRLLLIALSGCTAMDVISILRKKGVEIEEFEVRAEGERVERHPRKFKKILLSYRLSAKGNPIDQLERAVELSLSKYCSVTEMIREATEIESRLEVF